MNPKILTYLAISICLFVFRSVNAQTTLPKASKIPEKKVMEVNPPKTTFEKYEPSPLDSDTSSRKLTVEKSKFVISPDVMPAYIGGEVALYNFIQDYMIYPKEAKTNSKEGIVVVKFTIESDGRVTSPEIVMDNVGYGAVEEVKRLISLMPKWKPGYLEGQPVPVDYTMPVNFKIK